MSQAAMMRVLSCNMRSPIGGTMRLQQQTAILWPYIPNNVGGTTLLVGRSRTSTARFQSAAAPSTRRQQSTVFSSSAAASNPLAQQVARPPSRFRQLKDSLHSFLLKPRTVPVPRWVSPHHYTITFSEVCGHASFILVAVSYAMDDFLVLRLIAVAGSTSMLFFTYFHPHGRVLWLPFKWNLLFIAINSYRIGNVFKKRFLAQQLPDDLLAIRENHFYVLDPEDYYKLVELGRTETFKPGDLIISQGSMNRYIRLVVDGELQVIRDGFPTYSLEEGNFVSECGLHAGLMLPGKIESCCTIVALKTTHTLCWERTELMDFLRREKSIRSALKAALSWDIVRKLKWQRSMLAEHKIENAEEWTQKRNEQNFHRYAAILQNMLCHPQYLRERKEELHKYRMIHHIDDEHHRMALKQCGWTPEEFEAGFKEGQEDLEKEEEMKHDLKWHAQDLYLRVFG